LRSKRFFRHPEALAVGQIEQDVSLEQFGLAIAGEHKLWERFFPLIILRSKAILGFGEKVERTWGRNVTKR